MIDLSLYTTPTMCDLGIMTLQSQPQSASRDADIQALRVHKQKLSQPNLYFYTLTNKRKDSKALVQVMSNAADDLNTKGLQGEPIGLIGQIQSGKTRAFIGIIAKCFDLGFDAVVLFTKSSVALVAQTISRLESELAEPIHRKELEIFDAIKGGKNFSSYQAKSQKNIIVTKKQSTNLDILLSLVNGCLKGKKILLVDDEADIVSMTYKPSKTQIAAFADCADKLDQIRKTAKGNCAYLQVTATPYCLYLQPVTGDLNNIGYEGLRPCCTHILEPHSQYIGGKYYFEDSKVNGSVPSFLFNSISDTEMAFLNQTKQRNKRTYAIPNGQALTDRRVSGFRCSLYRFLLAGAIRYLSDSTGSYRCASLIHTKTSQDIHFRQKELYDNILDELKQLGRTGIINNPEVMAAYNDLRNSILASGQQVPNMQDVVNRVCVALANKEVSVQIVNSNKNTQKIQDLLDNDGQLKLTHPYNVFIGAQSLDRGITINNLISMMYGRSSNQMDTVLQHARMYGSRSAEDLSVTRFNTTQDIHNAMEKMYSSDKHLREQLTNNREIVFIAREGTRVIPCGPAKIRASWNMVTYMAGSFLLPIGFDVRAKIANVVNDIKTFATSLSKKTTSQNYDVFNMTYNDVVSLFDMIEQTYIYHNAQSHLRWDKEGHLAAIQNTMDKNTDNVLLYVSNKVKSDTRKKQSGEFNDAPYDGRTDSPICRALATNTPVIMLLRIKGETKKGWHGEEFYWPVIVIPQNSKQYVYTP